MGSPFVNSMMSDEFVGVICEMQAMKACSENCLMNLYSVGFPREK